jgi:putative membrane protein
LAAEAALFRKPLVVLATLALIFVPSLYVLIYVSSVWDPYGSLSQLPAALVNEDQPVERNGRHVALGEQVAKTLLQEQTFAFRTYPDQASARAAVRDGRAFFALLLPKDFSAQAMAANDAKSAEMPIYLSEGGNYTASLITKRFGSELAHTVNETINRERWAALLDAGTPKQPGLSSGLAQIEAGGQRLAEGAGALKRGADELALGMAKADTGANRLSTGSVQLATAAGQLTDGLKRVTAAVGEIQSKLPTDEQMQTMAAGSHALVDGMGKLNDGFRQLEVGETQLVSGARQLQEGSAKVPIWGGRVSAGAGELKAGIEKFGGGLVQVDAGSQAIGDGMAKLDTGVQPLTAGVIKLNAGLRTLASQLPKNEQLDLFANSMIQLRDGESELARGLSQLRTGAELLDGGSQQVESGAQQLAAGVGRAATGFDEAFAGAVPQKLAVPVQAKIETVAPVPNNGPAFSPYFSSLSLWIGAIMMSFIFHLRRVVAPMASGSRWSHWFAKALFLYLIGIGQATVVFGVLTLLLKIQFVDALSVWEIAVIGSFAFVSVILCFMTILGDAGRLLAVILLIFQLAASGGIYPVELSHSFYQRVHPYLPFSILVRGFRATMFGAFDGHWAVPAQQLLGVALGTIVLGMIFARWKYVPADAFGPAVDV